MLLRCVVLILGLLFLIFNGCATLDRSLPTAETLLTYDIVPQNIDSKALNRGRALAVRQCSDCHRFFFPEEYPPEEWRVIIPQMAKRMSLSKEQLKDIDLYFQVASRALR